MNFIIITLVIAFLWGLQPLVQKSLLKDLSSHSVLLVSNIIFSVCLVVYSYFYREVILEDFKKLESHHWKLLLFSAIICSFLTSITYFELIKNHKSSIIMALTYSAPVFTVLLGEIFLHENVHTNAMIGVYITALGLAIMSYYGQ